MNAKRKSFKPILGMVWVFLLHGISSAQAETVIFTGNVASGIQDLEVNGTLYDVEFVFDSADNIYGDPPNFDFDTESDATAATDAVRAALNNVPAVTEVGPGQSPRFTIGYTEDDFIITVTVGWSGTYIDGTWADTGVQAEPPSDSQTYANFTPISSPHRLAPLTLPVTCRTQVALDFVPWC